MRFSVLAASVFALVACTPPAPPPAPAPPAPPAAVGFTINATLSEKALAKLTEKKEGVVVNAAFYGEPQPGFEPKEAGDVGVDLGQTDATLEPAAAIVANFAPSFEPAKLAREVKGEPRVLINVFSARRADENNLLSCDIFDGPVSAAVAATPTVICKLIEE